MATGGFVPINDLKELNTCPIHLDLLVMPKRLPCNHVICQTCLEEKHKVDVRDRRTAADVLRCPLDQLDHELPAKGIHGFPNDHHANAINDLIQQSISSVLCTVCQVPVKDGQSNCYCFDCGDVMCPNCGDKHSRSTLIFRDHIIVSITDTSKLAELRCKVHENLYFRLYCFDCMKSLCQMCIIEHETHSLCKFKPSDERLDVSRVKSLNDLRQSEDHLKWVHDHLERSRAALVKSETDTVIAIKNNISNIRAHLYREQTRLQAESNSYHERRWGYLAEMKQETEKAEAKTAQLRMALVGCMMFKGFPEIKVQKSMPRERFKESLRDITTPISPRLSVGCVLEMFNFPELGRLRTEHHNPTCYQTEHERLTNMTKVQRKSLTARPHNNEEHTATSTGHGPLVKRLKQEK